jgi:hypothetical protein
MSDQQPAPAAESEPQLKNPLRTPRVCRYIKSSGEQCRGRATTGNHYCHCHKYNRKPSFTGVKGYDRVGFLEDTASIQLTCSQILQGVLDRTIDNFTARTGFIGLSVAISALRDLRIHERWLAQNQLPVPEQVSETVHEDGEEMAPEKEYRGPTGTFAPQWSLSKHMYEQQCEKAGQPKPICAEDFPESGWLTGDEITEDPHAFAERYQARINDIDSLRKAFESDLANILNGPTSKPKEPSAIEDEEDDEPAGALDPPVASTEPFASENSVDLSATAEIPAPGAPGLVIEKSHYYKMRSKQTTSPAQRLSHPGVSRGIEPNPLHPKDSSRHGVDPHRLEVADVG